MSTLQFYPRIQFPLPPSYISISHSCNLQQLPHHCNPSRYIHPKAKQAKFVLRCSSQQQKPVEQHTEDEDEDEDEDEEEEFKLLTSIRSSYNQIVIIDTPKSLILLLDSTYNVHSTINKGSKWTGSYWDEFAALPPVVPTGPIAIFGLGGGTAAHLMLELWPSLQVDGWEIDEILIDKARDYLGLSDLEKPNIAGGVLNVHIGDAFSSSASIPGGYAGIIVDLFSDGKVLPQLQETATWLELNTRLMPKGRFMVNCGAGEDGISEAESQKDGTWELNATIRALCTAFPGQVTWKKMPNSANYLALTGPLPDMATWSANLPRELSSSIHHWRTC